MRVDQEPRLPGDEKRRGVAAIVAYLFGEQQIDGVEGVHPGNLAELGLGQRPKSEGFGAAAARRVRIFREQRQVAPVFPSGRQLEIILDRCRFVGDVLTGWRCQFVFELDEPVRQQAEAVLVDVALVVAFAALRLVEGGVAIVFDLEFSVVDDGIAHLELGMGDGARSERTKQENDDQRCLYPTVQRSPRGWWRRPADP